METDLKKIEKILWSNLNTYDPYDLWKTNLGQWLKKLYYGYGKITIPIVAPFFLLDAYAPRIIRSFVPPQEFPTVRALAVLSSLNFYTISGNQNYIDLASASVKWLIDNQSPGYHGACWGLNMPWMTKTGYYPPTMPFITHTPYCFEALMKYSEITQDCQALDVALSSLGFLEKDIVPLLDSSDELALSYGPRNEGRIVINANAYAVMMYSLLANKLDNQKKYLMLKANRIFNFIKRRQNEDGSWYYYDDKKNGNFIDCFHSCFVLKNIIKYGKYAEVNVEEIVNKGIDYILNNLLDIERLLVQRFSVAANPSLVKFDLYDQAELLNVLCLSGRIDYAKKIHQSIWTNFYIPSKNTFGSQIDIFGRLNTMEYLRWAVMPAIYTLSEHRNLLE